MAVGRVGARAAVRVEAATATAGLPAAAKRVAVGSVAAGLAAATAAAG